MYYKNDQVINEVTKKFLNKIKLNDDELKVIKAYILQWIEQYNVEIDYDDFECLKKLKETEKNFSSLKKHILELSQSNLLRFTSRDLVQQGIDPF